ncbi:Aste57867_1845 [Aphanomyces stellatus]|uniref:Aste57867_1845 protein n=1 Tax=Aphanomyces stellatus TaxID=120398 RepID=A0A485K6Q9_9STRA|nr:hypothetical protein As57867_001843 [Aphanomyces stellatus]VFT79052.1 Aste57867_1845 [Aphanomyces stellatus]
MLPLSNISGYDLINSTISVEPTVCTASGGIVKDIFTNKQNQTTAPAGETFNKSTVCVNDYNRGEGHASSTIQGIAAGSAVVVLSVAACVYYYFWKRRRISIFLAKLLDEENEEKLNLRDLALCRLSETDIQENRVLGSGAFADVWLGTFQGRPVAIKKLHQKLVSLPQLQSFVDEILLMSTFESPFIVKLIGAAWTRPMDLQCVMEYMDSGDLRDYLISHDHQTFGWDEKVVHIQRIAEGLVYLHSMFIIHRDLKSRNVLLDSTKGTKLTDFGVSKADMEATMTMGVGTFRWMAPEVIKSQNYTIASDIYSFGMVLSEFATHLIPYEKEINPDNCQRLGDMPIMVKVVTGEVTPNFGSDCPEWLRQMALECVAHDPDARPSAVQISHRIRIQLGCEYFIL